MFFSTSRTLDRLRRQIATMRVHAGRPEAQLVAVAPFSGWTPSEHLDHSIKVSAAIVDRLLQLDAPRGTRGFSALGRLILMIGRIPRGKGKSPERVRGARTAAADLHAALTKLDQNLALLTAEHLAAKRGGIVPHPRFGDLAPATALRFTAIHNDHHLRIVDDIMASVE